MHAMPTAGEIHLCRACSRCYEGTPRSAEKLCCDEEAGTLLENVCTDTVYYCNDPRGSCELGEDDIAIYPSGWQCGSCQQPYVEAREAIACCTF